MGAFEDAINHQWPPSSGNIGDVGIGFDVPSSGNILDKSFSERLEATGQEPEEVDDRRTELPSGYTAMQAYNNLVGGVTRHLFPSLKSMDFAPLEPAYHKRQSGHLREEAGYYDILSQGFQ